MRVLLVGDETSMGTALRPPLFEHGMDLDFVATGAEAKSRIECVTYEALLVARFIGQEDGLHVCSVIREKGFEGAILMLTKENSDECHVAALRAGIDDYVLTSCDLRVLVERIRARVRSSLPPNSIIRVGRIAIDCVSRVANVDETRLSLSKLEFDLLALLARSAGTAVSRPQLLERLWSAKRDGSNTLDVTILRLRAELGNARVQLETVRGVGYRLVPGR